MKQSLRILWTACLTSKVEFRSLIWMCSVSASLAVLFAIYVPFQILVNEGVMTWAEVFGPVIWMAVLLVFIGSFIVLLIGDSLVGFIRILARAVRSKLCEGTSSGSDGGAP
ncbi:hypothetical protein [Ruegeria sp. HKCCD8929]|uniref:hypothetical protein n=1 Tax=Ruegeria sp. HKCCD8929 TaxID=2683006 RepID=UPI0014890F3E|nr:hypothetical protein [Ruegeria sp. HKCCD8929]